MVTSIVTFLQLVPLNGEQCSGRNGSRSMANEEQIVATSVGDGQVGR